VSASEPAAWSPHATPSPDLTGMRRDYQGPSFDETTIADNPVAQFRLWFDDMLRVGATEPNAMSLATVDEDGVPWQRNVLLKEFGDEGFVFFTNYESAKARHIAGNPRVSLLFSWLRLHRQVSVSGTAARVPRAQTESYFTQRPRGSQLAAWASPQSRVLNDRGELTDRYAAAAARFDTVVPPPQAWGGFLVVPQVVEFWQGRANRLHDRLRFRRDPHGAWVVERLAP
jgi:pyridoxamine 5'-phosphate oxidase